MPYNFMMPVSNGVQQLATREYPEKDFCCCEHLKGVLWQSDAIMGEECANQKKR